MEIKTLHKLIDTIKMKILLNGKNKKRKYEKKEETIQHLTEELDNYVGTDWKNFIEFNNTKYNRIKLFQDDYFEVLLICWNKNQSTQIHKHPKNGCVFKTLQGILYEKRYKTKMLQKTMSKTQEYIYDINTKSSYIDDSIGVHKIEAKEIESVSLHIYSPPLFYN